MDDLDLVGEIRQRKIDTHYLYVESERQNKGIYMTKQKQMHRHKEQTGGYQWGGAFQVVLMVKNPPAIARDVRDVGSIPGFQSERSPGGGHGNPHQHSCLENPHGQRSLAGYSPCSCKELNMTSDLACTHASISINNATC